MKSLVLVLVSLSFILAEDYDAEKAITRRTEIYKNMCRKLADPRRPEYHTLFEDQQFEARLMPNAAFQVGFCAPQRVGAGAWIVMSKRLHGQAIKKLGREIVGEEATPQEAYQAGNKKLKELTGGNSTEAKRALWRKCKNVMVVRHPLERLLSAYIATFVDSSLHRDLTHKLHERWLSGRDDPLKPRKGEDMYDVTMTDTLTFRQFVYFLTRCPEEFEECKVYTAEGLAEAWRPFWRHCSPCNPDSAYDYVLEMGPHAKEEKEYIFDRLGLDNELELIESAPARMVNPKDEEVKRKYFGQLTKQEIFDLYNFYKLDHDLFGYDPQPYIDMGMEERKP